MKEQQIKIVREILEEFGLLEHIYLHGSRAKQNNHKYSDLDLLLKAPQKIDFKTLCQLKDCFEDSNLPFKVDLVDWFDLAENYREEFLKNAVKLEEFLSRSITVRQD